MTARRVLWVLAGGFAVTILLLLGSAWLSVEAVDAAEARNAALLRQHRFSTQLIDEIQGENAGLSGVFYALAAGPRPVDRGRLLARLDTIDDQVRHTLESARTEATKQQWADA